MNLLFKMPIQRHFSLNPIMVKELRQFVRSKAMSYILIFFLAIPLFSIGMSLITDSYYRDMAAGQTLFYVLLATLGVACNLFVPVYIGIRLAKEYSDVNADLLFVTALTPGMIVRGKLYSGVVITFLLFSVSMPFMTFTYLLRGIDLLHIFQNLAFIFFLSVVLIQIAILLGALPLSRFFKLALVIGLLYGAFPMGSVFMYGGAGRMSRGISGPVIICMLMAFIISYLLSLVIFMPTSSNWSFHLRGTLTILWLISGTLSIILASVKKDGDPLQVWSVSSIACLSGFLPLIVNEPSILSQRVRRAIPRNRFLKIFVFPFFTCVASGIVWVGLVTGITIATVFMIGPSHNFTVQDLFNSSAIVVFIYVLSYTFTAVLIRRHIFKERLPHVTWLITLILIAAGTTLPLLIGLFSKNIAVNLLNFSGPWLLGNIPSVFWRPDYLRTHMLFASCWASGVILLNLRWFFKQILEFRPLYEGKLP